VSGIGAFIILLAIAALTGLVWLFVIAPLAATLICVLIAAMVVASVRRAHRPNPFGGAGEPERNEPTPDDHIRILGHADDGRRTLDVSLREARLISQFHGITSSCLLCGREYFLEGVGPVRVIADGVVMHESCAKAHNIEVLYDRTVKL